MRGNNKGSIEGVVRGSGEEEWGEGGGWGGVKRESDEK